MEKYELIIKNVIKQFGSLDHNLKGDLMQELRMFIFQNKQKFENEAADINKYMFIVLKRQIINLLKNSKYRKFNSLNSLTESGDEYINLIAFDDSNDKKIEVESELLEAIKEKLNKQDQDILISYFYKEKTYKEIGNKYGVSADTMRRRMQKILDEIKRWWK